MYQWTPSQSNIAIFPMVNSSMTEVPGLGDNLTILIGANGGGMVASACQRGEVSGGNGQYWAIFPASECPRGLIVIQVTAPGCLQQNLYASCGQYTSPGAVKYTHTVTFNGNPVHGAMVWIATDANGSNVVASGSTNTLGQVDFWLEPGTYYVFKRSGVANWTNPETVQVT